MTYNERIFNLRDLYRHKQVEIAEFLNIGQTTYSDYERGALRMPVECLIKLADFYNVDMNYICGLSDKKAPFPAPSEETGKGTLPKIKK